MSLESFIETYGYLALLLGISFPLAGIFSGSISLKI